MEEFLDSPGKEEGEMTMPLWRMLVEKDWDLLQSIHPRNMDMRGTKMLKDLLVESGPALIAMKGLPRTGKTFCASDIASGLRCANLNFDDVRTCTQQTHQQHLLFSAEPKLESASAHNDDLDELSYRALSTQLLLGHDVVVDSPLASPAVSSELLDLAVSNNVPLIIVECTVFSKSTWGGQQYFDGEDNNIPRLLINTAQDRFDTDGLNEVILKFILLYKQNIGANCKVTASSANESGREGGKLKRHFSDCQPLVFVPEGSNNDKDAPAAAASSCRICLQPITGSSYNCPQCGFGAHQSCIDLPQYTRFPLHIHPLGLYVLSYSNDSEEDINCIVCNSAKSGPIYRCWQCYGVFVHHKCAQLSHELKHPCHEHPLKLDAYDLFPSRNQFTCRACGHKGGKISYGCSACKLKLHLTCALDLPHEVEYKCAQRHPLVLASPPKDNKYDEYYCDVCEEERHGDYWIYYCASCEFHAHLNCVNPEIQAYDMAKADNSPYSTSDGEFEHRSDDDDDKHWSDHDLDEHDDDYLLQNDDDDSE
ncbi:hypothetical protein CRG98_048265 [Punica granatum]|uniref:DC1 domain-containing protein n=1 Tax=Punica granatum TaxID=22663 RepID=A0A2I0HI08_PUNGR|nr:hypothetical protein CRG98_048265 [Punica granatum]